MAKRFVAVLITLCAALAALCLSGCAEEDGKPSYQLVSEASSLLLWRLIFLRLTP